VSPRVLVCDDHPVVRDAITACLKAIAPGADVAVCATARQALDRMVAPTAWDLVVLDLELPDARGVDALIRLRRRVPQARIVVLSAHDDRETVGQAMRAGADEFVSKSSDRDTLLGVLRRHLELPGPELPGTGDAVIDGVDGDAMHEATIHDAIGSMSPRQLQVLRLMLRGLPNKEICRELGLSENTVKIHIGAVLRALQARNRTEAVARASRVGFSSGD